MLCFVYLFFRGWEWYFFRCFFFADDYWGCCCEICLRGLYVVGVCFCVDLIFVVILVDSVYVVGLICIRFFIGIFFLFSYIFSYGIDNIWIN